MVQRWLQSLYRRLGPRYPQSILVTGLLLQNYSYAVGIWVLGFFLDVALGDYLQLLLAAVVIQSVFTWWAARLFRSELQPVVSWLRGDPDRDPVAAWEAAASLPVGFFRRVFRYLLPLTLNAPWTAFAIWRLELPGWAFPVLLAAQAVALLSAVSLLFFFMEWALRPLLHELSEHQPDDVVTHASGLPMRMRLLATLPAMNIVGAFFVAGVSRTGEPSVGDLGIVILLAFAWAFVLSFWLTELLAGSVAVPIRHLQEGTERLRHGDLDTRVPVVSSDETADLARSFNRMVIGLQERERLGEAFGAFVDPELVERVLRDGTDLAGEEVELSVLFMDIRGFTAFSERAEASDVVARLNDLYGRVVPVVLQHGGHANKFIGDGLLAVFGAPDRLVDHADRAVAAALDIARLVTDQYQGELRVGIGVNSGPVVAGTIGGGGRVEFTVIGDTVNTAARVESATRQTGDDLLITEATRGALSGDFGQWDERPPVALKGKTEPVRLFAPA